MPIKCLHYSILFRKRLVTGLFWLGFEGVLVSGHLTWGCFGLRASDEAGVLTNKPWLLSNFFSNHHSNVNSKILTYYIASKSVKSLQSANLTGYVARPNLLNHSSKYDMAYQIYNKHVIHFRHFI